MSKSNLLKYSPVQEFINEVGQEIKKYFGKDKGCIIYLLPDGIFYGQGLWKWLGNKKNITLATMDDDGKDLEEEKLRGRKILIVDNDIVTGKGYKRVIEAMRLRKSRLHIKDVKFAVFSDRTGLADFSVTGYLPDTPWNLQDLDALDLKIIQFLSQDGRKSFVEIAKEIELSSVGVKKRVEKLFKKNIFQIKGLLNIAKFYSVSANISIDSDKETCKKLIKRLENLPLVYGLVRVSGANKNLIVDIVAPNLKTMEEFIEEQIKTEPGVRSIEVNVGSLPIIPKGINKATF
ncbi:Lrp/AsnC family transcriptional regulator [Patescibacteria group bacterium]|nr:Lrp/AsnC family transcriptional regulator [Patescibacteria group bacterium]